MVRLIINPAILIMFCVLNYTMRLAIELSPNTDLAWNTEDQYKLRGRLWKALKDTTYEKLHNNSDTPTFVFSNIFSISEKNSFTNVIKEKEESMLLISSPHTGLLDMISADLNANPQLNIGDKSFTVTDVQTRDIDVGPVGASGTIKTSTGLYIRLPQEERNKYNIETSFNKNSVLSWTPEMNLKAFHNRIVDDVSWKVNTLCPTIKDTPNQFQDIFESVNILTTFQADVNVTEDYKYSFFPVVCEFEYVVKSETHRLWLNTIIDTGLGWRNALGFGFLNKVD